MSESWKPVAGYEGIYSVSSGGSIRSELRQISCPSRGAVLLPERILRPGIGDNGYQIVTLQREGQRRSFRVHVLVAAAFIGPRPNGMDVAHRDGSKTNNTADNLRYATRSENNADKRLHGTSGAKLTAAQAEAIRRMPGPHRVAAKAFAVSICTVSKIRLGERWAHLENAHE